MKNFSAKTIHRILDALILLLLVAMCQSVHAQDPQLPDVENIRIEGDLLVWDFQEGATGYNIGRNFSYYDTVRGGNSFQLTEPGTYRIIAFNDSGEYGFDRGTGVEYTGTDPDTWVSYSYDFNSLLVYQTCRNVNPGESCVARCPSSYTPEDGFHRTIYLRYMTGGACSTSDIVEADAWIGHRSYHCTVPTFSGEVVAQAICLPR